MVHLIGVHHGGNFNDLFSSREVPLIPSPGFCSFLGNFEPGTRIGVEVLSPGDWNFVKEDLAIKCIDYLSTLPRLGNSPEEFESSEEEMLYYESMHDPFMMMPQYSEVTDEYWGRVLGALDNLMLVPVFLEDRDTWVRYNDAMLNAAAARIKREREMFSREGEPEGNYDAKHAWYYQNERDLEALAIKIHEIDRDDKLLEAIKRESVIAAIVGQAHSDYWWRNKNSVPLINSIGFSGYSTDLWADQRDCFLNFSINGQLEKTLAFERERVFRRLRIAKKGRVTDENPDYVGSWDTLHASIGFFEMFISHRNGENVSGIIKDGLGDASFVGREEGNVFTFVKKYGTYSARGAARKPIQYKAVRFNGDYAGFFWMDGFGQQFYMNKPNGRMPLDLSLRWRKSVDQINEEYRKIFPVANEKIL